MTLLDKISVDLVKAIKTPDGAKLRTVRAIKTALDRKRVDSGKPVTTEVEQQVLETMLKQRFEARDAFLAAGRQELADAESEEATIIESYLPPVATEEEIRATVDRVVAATEIPADRPMKVMGVVMSAVKQELAGKRLDGKLVSDLVKSKLV